MARQNIFTGTVANDGTGDTLRDAFTKVNDNFIETYSGLGNLILNGTTVTTSQPLLNLSQTWNAGAVTFTGLKFNATDTASASGSLLLDLQVGGSSRFSVRKDGYFGNSGDGLLSLGGRWDMYVSTVVPYSFTAGNFNIAQSTLSFSASFGGANSGDTFIGRDAANTLALRNGTNAQTFRVYETYTDASNYRRAAFSDGIYAEGAGTGLTGAGLNIYNRDNGPIYLATNNTLRWAISAAGHFIAQTDNTYDIGAAAATRPRSIYAGTHLSFGNELQAATTGRIYAVTGEFRTRSAGAFQFSSDTTGYGTPDTILVRDAANTLALRNGTNAQTFNVYNTYTDASNYERAFIKWSGNVLYIGSDKLGTGSARTLSFQTDGTDRWYVATTGHFWAAADNTYDIGAAGANRPRRVHAAGYFTAPETLTDNLKSSGGIGWLQYSSASISVLTPTSLGFGGTTSSFPALKRNSTALETKLADDSAYAPHAMQYLDVTDGITAPASATGRARIYVDTADGDLKVIFADGTVKTIVTDT